MKGGGRMATETESTEETHAELEEHVKRNMYPFVRSVLGASLVGVFIMAALIGVPVEFWAIVPPAVLLVVGFCLWLIGKIRRTSKRVSHIDPLRLIVLTLWLAFCLFVVVASNMTDLVAGLIIGSNVMQMGGLVELMGPIVGWLVMILVMVGTTYFASRCYVKMFVSSYTHKRSRKYAPLTSKSRFRRLRKTSRKVDDWMSHNMFIPAILMALFLIPQIGVAVIRASGW